MTEVIAMFGLAIGFIGAIWGVVRWADAKIQRAEERQAARVDDCHSRINELRKEMVVKDDLNRHLDTIERMIKDLKAEMSGLHSQLHDYLESLAARTGKETRGQRREAG